MNHHYYRAPLNLGQLTKSRPMAKCDIGESISQVLFLLICTRKGEMPGEPDFGCDIWDLQFEQIQDQRKWTDAIEVSLQQCINRFENRLYDAQVDASLREVEVAYPFRKYPDIKHQAHIQIKARLRYSGEPFNFSTDVFVSPISG